jgi:hypothetical protein
LTKVANVEEEADDDAMVLQEIDLNPEFRNQRGAKETFYQKRTTISHIPVVQTTFEGRTTIANHKKTSGKERNYSIYTLRFTKVTESYQQEFDQYFVTNMVCALTPSLVLAPEQIPHHPNRLANHAHHPRDGLLHPRPRLNR